MKKWMLLLSVLWTTVLSAQTLEPGVVYEAQGLVEGISISKKQAQFDGELYYVPTRARISEGDQPLKLRHLKIGTDVLYTYKRGSNRQELPEITSITVILK